MALAGSDTRVSVALAGPPRIRVEVDPLATAFTTLVEFYGPLRHRSSPAVAARAVQLGRGLPLPTLLRLLTEPVLSGVPDFFGLTDAHGDATFEQRLEAVRNTSPARMARDLAAYAQLPAARPDVYRDWVDRPERTLGVFCDVLGRYWREVVCAIYEDPEQRITEQARRLEDLAARHGAALAVSATNAPLAVTDDSVSFFFNSPDAIWTRPRRPRRARTFKPMICAPITVLSNFLYDDELWVCAAASTPALSSWHPRPAGDVQVPLAGLLGATRSRLVARLTRRSGTTTELADELGLAPSTVSHHLALLAGAGVVDARRSAGSVRYHLTDRGYRLLRI